MLPATADWLLAERSQDMQGLLVALPGGRAVRRLADLLARRAPADWQPPRIVTQGNLVDELLELERPPAGRLARTLAWRKALGTLDATELERLARGASARSDAESRLRLAETVRKLHGELAPDGLGFEDLAHKTAALGHEAEAARWHVLAKVQSAWRDALASCGLSDPHEGRRASLEAGRVDGTREVVLVGVADMNELLAGTLRRIGPRATALIAAPEEHAAGFDALGRLVAAYWIDQEVPLNEGRWFVEEKPGDQADRALDLIAGWCETHTAEEITVGLADEEVAPFLERRLRAAETASSNGAAPGARLRVAAGTPLARTRPFKLLRVVGDLLERRGFPELAALARHPDAAPLLGGGSTGTGFVDAADVLDRYYQEHLPRRLEVTWPGTPKEVGGVQRLSQMLTELLGELGREGAAPLATWGADVRRLLERVYAGGAGRLDPEVEEQRVLAGALRAIAKTLEELETVPVELLASGECPAHEALQVLLRALRSEAVPPAPARADQPTLEGLGWLELALDDAPAMVVTGFNEGRVPESIQGHAFLPNALRSELGLPDNDARLGRDIYAARVLLAQRTDVALVTGRRARSGDPLVPSRIAFQVPSERPEEVLDRVRRFLPPEAATEHAADTVEPPRVVLPRISELPPFESISVTAFGDYLESPYLFLLKRLLRLRSRHDRARELDPLQFGNFAHRVLQDLAELGPTGSSSPRELEGFLCDRVDARAHERFGSLPLPAIALQLDQLKYRLRLFSRSEARRRADGWRILLAEWQPAGGVPFDVDDSPIAITGKIDRIDVHEDGRWAILDYKTGEKASFPEERAQDKQGNWKDLQLPLYRYLVESSLASEHRLVGAPELGYFHVGRDEEHIGLRLATRWTDDDYQSALETARGVVRDIRDGGVYAPGKPRLYQDDHVFRALFGDGLLTGPTEEAP
jgi:hypothetical protein